MDKLEAIIAIAIGAGELIEEVVNFFDTKFSGEYYSSLDKLTFLTSKVLGFDYFGNISDSTKVIGEAFCSLSNFVVWGIVLLYLFVSLFSYFLSKKVEVPWKFFIRTIVFGVLINASFFICYSAVFFTENITNCLVECCGGDTSFGYLEDRISELGMNFEGEVDDESAFNMDNMIKVMIHIMIFLLNVAVGVRFILLKLIIVSSPIIFAFGCSRFTEKIFFSVSKLFICLLVYQIIMVVVLEIFRKINFTEDTILLTLVVATILMGIKFVKKMC